MKFLFSFILVLSFSPFLSADEDCFDSGFSLRGTNIEQMSQDTKRIANKIDPGHSLSSAEKRKLCSSLKQDNRDLDYFDIMDEYIASKKITDVKKAFYSMTCYMEKTSIYSNMIAGDIDLDTITLSIKDYSVPLEPIEANSTGKTLMDEICFLKDDNFKKGDGTSCRIDLNVKKNSQEMSVEAIGVVKFLRSLYNDKSKTIDKFRDKYPKLKDIVKPFRARLSCEVNNTCKCKFANNFFTCEKT